MAMCEDFPCCGHDHGFCPTEDGPVCVGCAAQLPKHAHSSLCEYCQREALRQADYEAGWCDPWDDEDEDEDEEDEL